MAYLAFWSGTQQTNYRGVRKFFHSKVFDHRRIFDLLKRKKKLSTLHYLSKKQRH